VAQPYQSGEPGAIADAVADVAHSAQRIVEERIELLRLEVRKDMRRILQASALGASGVVALAVAVGMFAGAVTWTLALWMPFGAALGITAVLTAVVGVVFTTMARRRLPGAEDKAEVSQETAIASSEDRRQLRAGRDAEASI
jgi:hypothetical protein